MFFQSLLVSSFILLGCVKYSDSNKETPKIVQDNFENDKTKSSTTIKNDSENDLANLDQPNNSKNTSDNSSNVVVPVSDDTSEKEVTSKSELEMKLDDFNNLSIDEKIEKWNAVFTSEEINSKLQKTYLTGPKLLHFLNFLNLEAMQKTENGAKIWKQISQFLLSNSDFEELNKNAKIISGKNWNQIWKIHAGQTNSSAENQITAFYNNFTENQIIAWYFFDLYSMFSSSIQDIIVKVDDLKQENKKYQIEFKVKEDIKQSLSFFKLFIQSIETLYEQDALKNGIIFNDFFYNDFNLDVEKLLKINK